VMSHLDHQPHAAAKLINIAHFAGMLPAPATS